MTKGDSLFTEMMPTESSPLSVSELAARFVMRWVPRVQHQAATVEMQKLIEAIADCHAAAHNATK